MTSLILQTATRVLIPLMVLYAVYLLLEGHHQPGGGFIGGLLVSAAVGLCAMAFDVPTALRVLPVSPHAMMGVGLMTSAASGLWAVAFGKPFLTGAWTSVPVPGLDDLHLGTPLLFDLGVFLVVIGVTTMALLALAED